MKRAIFALISSLFLLTAPAQAQDGTPTTFGFVTEDPFLQPGQAAKRNDITVLGGVFVADTFGGAAEFWSADYLDSYMFGAVLGRDFYDLGAGFVLGGVVGAAVRFGDDEPDTTGELWTGLRLRHQGLLIGNLLISPGITAGFSAVTGPTAVEREREILNDDADATFLGYIGPEIALRWRTLPNVELVTQVHHRSGAKGTFGGMHEASNAWTWGLRFKF
jgi:hypothetical protein